MYVYLYSQNHDHTTMHYYMHFYCMITYNLLHVFLLHIMTTLLYSLECTEIPKAGACPKHTHTHTHFSVGADRSQPPSNGQISNSFSSLLSEGMLARVPAIRLG